MARWRRLAAIGGLGYVAGVGIENMDVLGAPLVGASAADVRAVYAGDHALLVVSAVAGAASLGFYCLFVAGLFGFLRSGDRRDEPWPVVLLIGGIAGPTVAAMGQAAHAILVTDRGAGLSDSVIRSLFDLHLLAQMVAATFVVLFLVGVGVAALRSGRLPPWIAWLGLATAAPIALGPVAAATGGRALQVIVTVGFGLNMLWILLTSLWLALADGSPVATVVRRAAFLLLVLAAGLVGVGLLAAPGSTGQFFSWGLQPAPLAAFAGGVYVGSAAVYAAALGGTWPEVRGLVLGAAVLSVSVFAVTLGHLDTFDFDRLQAWAWVVLFAGFSVVTLAILLLGGEESTGVGAPLDPAIRGLLALVAGLLGALAIALWIDPEGVAGPSPFQLPPLGGRFAGCWVALLAVLAGWAALRNRADEARLPALALVTLPVGALVAGIRTLGDLDPPSASAGYLAALALLTAVGALAVRSTWREPRDPLGAPSASASGTSRT